MKRSFKTRALFAVLFLCLLIAAAVCLPGVASADDGVRVDNGIPVVYLNINEQRGTIEDMIASSDHSVYCYGTVSIDVPEGFHYSDFPDITCVSFENLEMSIRGRGNSTWQKAKKPFKIKLDKKADLFGLGANKHWVLVANVSDETLLRDRITAWLGERLGCGFTPQGVPVDVVMTGEYFGTQYLGSYYLSENVRVDGNRLNIAELDDDDTDPDVITGGYLIQNSSQIRAGSPDIFYTSRGANWATHTPSFDTEGEENLTAAQEEREEAFVGAELGDAYKNPAQQQYIQNYIQHFEDVLYEEGTAYRDLMDVESAAKYWLINEISRNSDAYATGSTYLYKDRDGENGVSKLYWGPLWDFDYAWNFTSYTQGFEYGHMWMKPMFCDRGEGGFVQALHQYWPELRSLMLELIADGGVIDQYYEETKASAEQDAALHRSSGFNYREEVDKLKTWIRERIDWVDAHFDELDDLVHKVTFLSDGEVWMTDFRTDSEPVTTSEKHPEKEGYTFIAWLDENGDPVESDTWITEDRVFTAQFVPDSELTHAEDIAWVKDSDVISYNPYFTVPYQIRYEVIPPDAEDQEITWSSSNEQYAKVDENGRIIYNGPGEVTVTAKLHLGTTRSFTLTVVQGEVPYAQAIAPTEPVIEMTVGSMSPCSITTEPSPAKILGCTYTSDDPGVVTVDELGALTAVGPGEATVRILVASADENGEDLELETVVTVIVTEKPVEYAVTPEGELTWTLASGEDLTLTVKRSEADETCFSHFTGVEIDGEALAAGTDYTAKAGSTVVTLPADTLEKLSAGKHTVKVVFDDGEAEAALEVLAADAEESPAPAESPAPTETPAPAESPAPTAAPPATPAPNRNHSRGGTHRTGDGRSVIWYPLAAAGFIGFALAYRARKKSG